MEVVVVMMMCRACDRGIDGACIIYNWAHSHTIWRIGAMLAERLCQNMAAAKNTQETEGALACFVVFIRTAAAWFGVHWGFGRLLGIYAMLLRVPKTPESCATERQQHTRAMRDSCAQLLLNSVHGGRTHAKRKSEPERAQLYKAINSNIIALLSAQRQRFLKPQQGGQNTLCDEIATQMAMVSGNLGEVVLDYVWITRCCDNATEIADTFNSNHLAGLLVCKSFSVLCSELDASAATPVSSFFPAYPTIHVCPTGIAELCYSELVFVVTSLQQKWDVLILLDMAAAARVLVCCMARFGRIASIQLSSKILDDTQEREHANANNLAHAADDDGSGKQPCNASCAANAGLWVLSKRAIRHFASTFVCMAREMAISNGSNRILVHIMSDSDCARYITDEVMAYGFKLAPDISDNIRACFGKVRSLRQHEQQPLAVNDTAVPGAAIEMPSTDKNWEFLMKKLGPHKLGPRPRKTNADFTTLLGDVIISLSDVYNHPANTAVTRSCLNIIQTALKFYYVVPSAERYREIVLMQNLCPGQRLNYAFDYMHFDTGKHTQQRVYAQRHHEYIHTWIRIQESDT